MHHRGSVELVEGEQEGGEVGKVVKSLGTRQPGVGKGNEYVQIFIISFPSLPVMRAVQVCESREVC